MANLARIMLSALIGATVLACALPVSAQPLRITVTDPGVIEPPPLVEPPSRRFVRPSTLFDYHLDFGGNFDPGKAAADSQFFVRPDPAINPVRAAVLERTGESIAEHQLRCQLLHPTYEPAGDTYLGPDGIPRPCVY
jgi:hypothetical protein